MENKLHISVSPHIHSKNSTQRIMLDVLISLLPAAIAGVVIGGTSLSGGVGSVGGTLIGVYVMSVLKNGLMSMNLQGQWQTFFTGIVVICAVLLDIYRGKKSNEVKKEKTEVKQVASTNKALEQ